MQEFKYADAKWLQQFFGKKIEVGPHGYVKLARVMGGDEDIVAAARTSYVGNRNSDERTREQDRRLLRLLFRERHMTPFEMPVIMLQVKVSMDTWRQWIRHRTMSVNEYSTRYRPAIPEKVTVPADKWRLQSKDSKQGSAGFFDPIMGAEFSDQQKMLHDLIDDIYQGRLDAGMAKEQARMDLPVCNYTEAVITMKARNLFHFLGLRMASDAQQEIREFADAISEITKAWLPLSHEAFEDYALFAENFSRQEIDVLRQVMQWLDEMHKSHAHEPVWQTMRAEFADNGMTEREWKALLRKLDL